MTPEILKPLHNVIIWAQQCADPLLWHEAARRFEDCDRALLALPPPERWRLEEQLFGMLPSDWPLWMESSRTPCFSARALWQ